MQRMRPRPHEPECSPTTGKPRMQAISACMRKRVMIAYGGLKNRAPFDPAWSSRIAT